MLRSSEVFLLEEYKKNIATPPAKCILSNVLFSSLSTQPALPLALPLTSWYSELSVALSVLHKVAGDPAAAADWLLSVRSALSSSQRLPSALVLIVTHLIIAGREDVCQLALNTAQAIATADPCQVHHPTALTSTQRNCGFVYISF